MRAGPYHPERVSVRAVRDHRAAAGYKVDILGSRLKDAKFSLPEAVNLLADLKIKLS